MKGAPVSNKFDDIYFSADDGLAETQHVFIHGNNLPQAWEGKSSYTVCETGFGTGLNFLALWKLFEETADENKRLDFISFEKFPLKPDFIREALKPWANYFGDRLDKLLDHYPIIVKGFHRLKLTPQITVTLVFDDVNEAIQELDADIDCWFLDGFTPAKNPEMWTTHLYNQMGRLSHNETTLATFTAAGDVRRGLQEVGFDIQKRDGFGRKRDMIVGLFKCRHARKREDAQTKKVPDGATIAIIGGGLAGTAAAYTLKQYGYSPVIYEAGESLAVGASGNNCGFYNPRFTALWDDVANFFAPAYAQFITMANKAGAEINYDPCGALHLINSPEKEKRFHKMIDNWGWESDHAYLCSIEEAGEIAGIKVDFPALYLPQAGSVSPQKLCNFYAQDVEVNLNYKVDSLDSIDADAIILCAGYNNADLIDKTNVPLQKVRGQVTQLIPAMESQDLQCNIHFGGYLSRVKNNIHHCGATFQKWEEHVNITDDDHDYNLKKMSEGISSLNHIKFEILGGWAGLRTALPDHFPILDRVEKHEYVYISTAYGSHGLVGSLQAAHGLADLLRGKSHALPRKTWASLSAKRFDKG